MDRDEVRRVSKIEVLDEVEEWELIMVRQQPGTVRRVPMYSRRKYWYYG